MHNKAGWERSAESWMRSSEKRTLEGGQQVYCHPASACAGNICCIHNPSQHRMRSWPQNWRDDRRIMERLCEHGVGHPDPDDLTYRESHGSLDDREWAGIHGCDGCCRPELADNSVALDAYRKKFGSA